MISIMVRIIKQVLNDKRSLAMIVVAPVFLLTLLFLLLGKNAYTPVVAIDGLPSVMVNALKSQNTISVAPKDSEETDEDYVKSGRADAAISMKKDGIHLTMLAAGRRKIDRGDDGAEGCRGEDQSLRRHQHRLCVRRDAGGEHVQQHRLSAHGHPVVPS